MRLGAHESIAGGMPLAVLRAVNDGCEAFQVFTRPGRSWVTRPLPRDEVLAFRSARRAAGTPVAAHASYLINLAGEPGDNRTKSLDCLVTELERCELLGLYGLVLHPGGHPDEARGLELVRQALDTVFARTAGFRTQLLLEITAGQGSSLGCTLGHLQTMRATTKRPERVGYCLDTCHMFMAGYDLKEAAGYDKVMAEVDQKLGLANIKAFHLNDCKKPFASRVDRHEEIGKGTLGLEVFRRLVNDARFANVPAFLETPNPEAFAEALALLRSLRAG